MPKWLGRERFKVKKGLVLVIAAVTVILVLVASAFINLESSQPASTPTPPPSATPTQVEIAEKKPFYFGVTYCGNSTVEAKQLVDKVKNYTNLFVIQSGPLMSNLPAMKEICDYAVDSGLDIIVYYAYTGAVSNTCANFTKIAGSRWGSHFLGLYYNDEPAGKLLDNSVSLADPNGTSVSVGQDGSIYVFPDSSANPNIQRFFYASGDIQIYIQYRYQDGSSESNTTTYFTNGTISFQASHGSTDNIITYEPELWYQPDGTVEDENGTLVTGHGSISQFTPYQQVCDSRPLQTYAEVADLYVNAKHNILSSTIGNQSNVKLMTSDYALYWFDYQAGYDTVFAQLGWGNNPTQEIALVRGAANMQGKDWGTVITWQSLDAPYLMSGDQMYTAMKQSYESGAKYVMVFNYNQTADRPSENATSNGASGLLQQEHFEAMKKFWSDVVQNESETNNVSVETAFVLPNSYGSGLRNQNDGVWGLWNQTSTSQQIWNQLQSRLEQYGSKIDIVYDDPAFPVSGKYGNVYYWNQTS